MLQKLKTKLFTVKQHAQLELIKNVSESCVSDFGSHGNSIDPFCTQAVVNH